MCALGFTSKYISILYGNGVGNGNIYFGNSIFNGAYFGLWNQEVYTGRESTYFPKTVLQYKAMF